MKARVARFRKTTRFRRSRRHSSRQGCQTCGADHFAHKPNSYYGHVEHAYKKR